MLKLPRFSSRLFSRPLRRKNPIPKKWRRAFAIVAALLIIAVGPTIYLLIKHPLTVQAAWADNSYSFRKAITITNAGSTLSDYQVSFTLDTATLISGGKMQSNCNDIRVTDSRGKVLSHWVQTSSMACNTSTTKVWAKLSSLPAGLSKIYIYYGNSSATNIESPSSIFTFFDDFNDNDISDWTQQSGSTWSVSSGVVSSTSDGKVLYRLLPSSADTAQIFGSGMRDTSLTNYTDVGVGYLNSSLNGYAGSIASDGSMRFSVIGNGARSGWTDSAIISPTVSFRTGEYYNKGSGSHEVRLKETGQGGTVSDATHSSLNYIALYHQNFGTGAKSGEFDWVYSRQYAATEPTTAFASEEVGVSPVAYWKFDEGTGTSAKDSSGNGLSATLTNSPTWQNSTECVSVKCLSFNSSNSNYAVTGNSSALSAATSASWGGWIKVKSLPTSNNLMGILVASSLNFDNGIGLSIYNNSGTTNLICNIRTSGGDSTAYYSTNNLTLGSWYNTYCTWSSGTGIKMYVNGNLAATGGTVSGTISNLAATPFRLGAEDSSGPTRYFNGSLDEMKVYRYERTSAQVKADFISGAGTLGSSAVVGFQSSSALSVGLKGYWKMDEASWTVDCSTGSVLDSSVNGINGKACPASTGPTGGGTGKYGNGGVFDGSNDSVNLGANYSYDYTQPMSVGAWIKTSIDGAMTIVSKQDVAPNYAGWNLQTGSTGNIIFQVVNTYCTAGNCLQTFYPNDTNYDDGKWHYVMATYDGSGNGNGINLYYDGQLLANPTTGGRTITTSSISSANTYIGARNGSIQFFQGSIDETRIYNRVLSPAEVAQLYALAPGPVGQWKLDENTGQATNDVSGNNNIGQLGSSSGVDASDPIWTPGKFGAGLSFDGGDWVNVPDAASLALGKLTDNYTVEAWGYQTGSGGQWLFEKGQGFWSDGNVPYALAIDAATGRATFVMFDGTHISIAGNIAASAVPYNTWVHLTGVRDSETDTVKLYINGVLVDSQTDTVTASVVTTTPMAIGNNGGGHSEGLIGSVDDIKVYNYIRTQSQIIEDMNGSHPIGGSPVGSQLLYWKMNEGAANVINNSGSGGTGYNGTNSGAAWLTGASCKVNNCLNFDTTTDTVSAGDLSFIDALTSLTTTVWLNPQTLATNKMILSKANTATQRVFQIKTDTTSTTEIRVMLASSASDTSNYCTTGGLGLTAATWQHVGIVYDGSQTNDNRITVYKNGVKVSCAVTGTIPTSLVSGTTSNFKLGQGDDTTPTALISYMDELKIYNSALTQDQMKLDYNLGSSITNGVLGTKEQATIIDGAGANPIGYWNMNENAGTTAKDTSGNNFAATLTNGPTWTIGKIGAAIKFDGIDDYLTTPDSSTLEGFTNMSVCSWGYLKGYDADGSNIIIKPTQAVGAGFSDPYTLWGLYVDPSGRLDFHISTGVGGSGKDVVSTSTIPLNQWTYMCGVYNGATMRVYINGALETPSTSTTLTVGTNAQDVRIGAWMASGANDVWNGYLDDIKLYNYARTPAQVSYDYNRGAAAGWWKFDECQGATANDSSGNNHPGTIGITGLGSLTSTGLCGSGTSTHAWNLGTTGRFNSGLGLDGTDDSVSLGNNFNFNYNNPMSVSIWFKTTSNSGMSLISKQDSSAPYSGWNLQTASFGKLYFQLVNTYCTTGNCIEVYSNANNNYYDGNWHNFVATYTGSGVGSGVALYFDGKQLTDVTGTATTLSTASTNSVNTQIGSRNNAAQFFSGTVDDTRIFNYALSPDQVKKLYNFNSSVNYGPASGAP